MAPRMTPRVSPARISRNMTCHHWARPTSPSASARITRVAAWEPELPPLEMMSGTNSASTTARSISRSKKLMAVAVSISPRNRMTSQPPRRRIIDEEPHREIRLVEGFHTAEALQRARGRRLRHVEHVVDGDDADQHALRIRDGQRHPVLVLEDRHRRFLRGPLP